MRLLAAVLFGWTLVLAPPRHTQVLASSSSSSSSSSSNNHLNAATTTTTTTTTTNDHNHHHNKQKQPALLDDLYLDDFGSGEGPDNENDLTTSILTHIDAEEEYEGSGHGHGRSRGHDKAGSPYGATYDTYDDTEDGDYDDGGDLYPDGDQDFILEGSGAGVVPIDKDDTFRGTEIIEETIILEEIPETKEELPPPPSTHTFPPPTSHPDRPSPGVVGTDMESPVQIHTTMNEERQVSIFAQPGILAAFIGGAVVGLLCAILLVMFIVYRMRKKDEGSYPLDEPKRMPLTSSYSPNDKEIYA